MRSIGGTVSDSATLAGGSTTPLAGGTITFTAFGPSGNGDLHRQSGVHQQCGTREAETGRMDR